MGHSEGICHVYLDSDANIEKAIKIGESGLAIEPEGKQVSPKCYRP
ncbi:hypothetical protein scyTo_0026760, partial [Scyliorhinus torazame]|nr:hypothetical protein [Scyliorhinus torazame]